MKRPKKQTPEFPERHLETMKLLTIHRGFIDDVAALRTKTGIPICGFADTDEANIWLAKLRFEHPGREYADWMAALKSILAKYRLPRPFLEPIADYIRTGLVLRPESLGFELLPVPGQGSTKAVLVHIFEPLSKKDWSWMKISVDNLLGEGRLDKKRARVRSNIDRDISILRSKQGKQKQTDAELVTQVFGDVKDDSRDADLRRAQILRQVRSRLRKVLKERFE